MISLRCALYSDGAGVIRLISELEVFYQNFFASMGSPCWSERQSYLPAGLGICAGLGFKVEGMAAFHMVSQGISGRPP